MSEKDTKLAQKFLDQPNTFLALLILRINVLLLTCSCGLCAAGRGQETPGEDPVLNSDYAEGFVSGFQTGEDPHHLKASCCCKHYAGYSLESWSPHGPDDPHPTSRHDFNAVISEQDLTDTYFPPFMSCANRGNASGVMCSYSKPARAARATEFRFVFSRLFVLADAVNGVPSCASHGLLNVNLREKWGFNGYVTSDCGAVGNVEGRSAHHFTTTDDATCAVTLGALQGATDRGFRALT